MGKVEFYFDDHKIGTTTVSPFGFRWTISMNDPLSNTLRAALDSPNPSREVPLTTQFTFTRTESYDGKEYKEGDTITKTLTAPVVKRKRAASLDYTNGYSAMLDLNNPATAAFTETHTIWVRAFDAAGNTADSQKLKFFVSHKPPDEKKPTGLEWRRDEFAMFDEPSRVRAQRANMLKV